MANIIMDVYSPPYTDINLLSCWSTITFPLRQFANNFHIYFFFLHKLLRKPSVFNLSQLVFNSTTLSLRQNIYHSILY